MAPKLYAGDCMRFPLQSSTLPANRAPRTAHSRWGSANQKRCLAAQCSRPKFIDIGDDWIEVPKPRKELWPSYDFTKEKTLELQLQAAKNNNQPYPDYGIEILYRFANIDPFKRSPYFGKTYDLGQFERFRRIMHSPCYQPLLNHAECRFLASLQVNEHVWKQRITVADDGCRQERTYTFTLLQRVGGRYDGFWYTDSLTCEDEDCDFLYTKGI